MGRPSSTCACCGDPFTGHTDKCPDCFRLFEPMRPAAKPLSAFEQEARRVAAAYNHDIEVLSFERDRYAFGSLTTTANAKHHSDVLWRAWAIALQHQRTHRTAEAA